MPAPSTLNEALAEIEVLNTQIAYLTEQADIAQAIEDKVIPDYSTVLGSIDTTLGSISTDLGTVAENTTPPTPATPAAAPAAPVVNTGVV